jgi:hypothetical protein
VILSLPADGSLTLTTIGLLSHHLNEEHHRALLEQARHKSRREVEVIVAALRPQPPVPSTIRKLPTTTTAPGRQEMMRPLGDVGSQRPDTSAPVAAQPKRPAIVTPLTPEQYRVQFTVSRETHDKLRRAQELLRHAIPNGDPAVIFDRALTLLLDSVAKTTLAASTRPTPAPLADVRSSDGRADVPSVASRVPPGLAVCRRRGSNGEQYPASLPNPQRVRGRAVVSG